MTPEMLSLGPFVSIMVTKSLFGALVKIAAVELAAFLILSPFVDLTIPLIVLLPVYRIKLITPLQLIYPPNG